MYTREQLNQVVKEEEEIVFPSFDREDAFRLAQVVFEMASAEKAPVCCQVVLNGFEVVRFFLDGTDESNIIWLTRKKNSVIESGGWSSLRCGMERELNGVEKAWHEDTENYVIRGGGVPIHDKAGKLLGVLCISGMVHFEDHALGMSALRKYMEAKENT